ncbi:MAG TPA: sodium:solute symporter, partial [Hyphomicrobiaceae bacterium]|nr:sodium:solute symporter [Hyphomicrobiaceae bacterium]
MLDGKTIISLALGYVGLLFVIAWLGDRFMRRGDGNGRPIIYALSLAVYCTSWTFFGSVGLAARTGYDFLPIYIGPILVFLFGWRLIQRVVRLAKSQNITSVADFLAARYGKSAEVAAIVALIALVGTLPYIALQLKAVAVSVETLLGRSPFGDLMPAEGMPIDTAFIVMMALAIFAVLFGTRHIDATEHQHGLMLAIAAESLVKLATFVAVGAFVTFGIFGSVDGLAIRASQSLELSGVFGKGINGSNWLVMLVLSSVCILLLPRQFHVTVVENNSETEIRRARWLFPLYLIVINIFVIPIAAAGLILLPANIVDQDMYVLALPMWANADVMTMLAFVGGLSAATAMVIVECVALAIMLCNGVIVPLLLRHRVVAEQPVEDVSQLLLLIRRCVILVILVLGYAVYRALAQGQGLASIGLVAFAAIAQLAPAFFIGLIWRRATARGAIAGILAGFAVWSYTLLLPWVVKSGWLPASIIEHGPLGIGVLRPQALFYLQFEPLTHGVLWSLATNVVCYVVFSLLKTPEP